MKKSWLVGIYIVMVLLIAGFAKAQGLYVDRVFLDESHYLLKIGGRFQSTCETAPRIEVSRPWWQASMQTVTVRVIAETDRTKVCATDLSRSYDLMVDLRQLNLPVDHPVLVSVIGAGEQVFAMHRVQVKAPLSAELASTVDRVGTLENGNTLVLDNGQQIEIKTVINLEPYIGKVVHVKGLEAMQTLAPADAETLVFDPSSNSSAKSSFLVTEISSVPLQ